MIYAADGSLYRRMVPGPWMDETVGYLTAGTTRYWPIQDHQNSDIALTSGAGSATFVNTYDEYGRPGPNGNFYIGYTGQVGFNALPDLWSYKARFYNPRIGRFMQTDPILYGDGLNLYGYVGNGPLNWVDPWGLCVSGAYGGDLTRTVPGHIEAALMVFNLCREETRQVDDGYGGGYLFFWGGFQGEVFGGLGDLGFIRPQEPLPQWRCDFRQAGYNTLAVSNQLTWGGMGLMVAGAATSLVVGPGTGPGATMVTGGAVLATVGTLAQPVGAAFAAIGGAPWPTVSLVLSVAMRRQVRIDNVHNVDAVENVSGQAVDQLTPQVGGC